MNSLPPIRAGVVGVGSLGQHHARVYSQMPGVTLAGVYDADPARAAEIAAKHGTTAFSDLAAFTRAVDCASVAVPTNLHREVAGQLLESGLHLLVEKPIAETTREAEELVALADARRLILQVGHVERFNPVLGVLEGRGQAPRFIEAHRLAPYPPPRPGLAPRGTEVSVVLDLMIHDIEVVLHLVASPLREIRAVGMPVLSPSEDIANVRLEFENGAVANLTSSRISPDRMRKIRAFYPDCYLSLDYQAQAGELHRLTPQGIVREELSIDKGDALTIELTSFVDCVRHHHEPKVTGERAAEALRIATRITAEIRERNGARRA